ncbi:MAG: cytochrome c-type biogenesis protein CcmH [Terracidiphilus sp.]|jgi:cytochrome c-type biogenesis protein CcmH
MRFTMRGFVSGHDISRAEHPEKNGRALAPAGSPGPAKNSHLGITFWIKCTQAALLAIAVCFSVGATDASSRYNNLNHRLMCTCSCAQILGECNHVGCPNSTGELNELRAGIAAGGSDKEILDGFVGKYGAIVLAAPTTHGFDLVAWIAPFAVFAAALLGTILLVRRWANISIGKTQAAGPSPINEDPADRERKERIRRETGEGGF